MLRRPLTISLIRVTGTRRLRANPLMLSPSDTIRSSRRISPGCTGGSRRVFAMVAPQTIVIVDDLYVLRVAVLPDEADSVLIVDPDTVLPAPIARQRFQPVAGKCRQVSKLA